MADVAAIFVSPLLQVLFEKLISVEFADFFRQRELPLNLVWQLKKEFLAFNAVLENAEDLEDIKPAVKEWLDELKDEVRDTEDVLDEIATEALRSQLEPEIQSLASKVRKCLFASRNSFVKEMVQKINGVLKNLETLRGQINVLGLKERSGSSQSERQPTSSLVDESIICGRDDDKATIVSALLSDDARNNGISVIAIVGMGGLGKTTLAQLVYNDRIVRGHFDCFAWVCVSDKFEKVIITKRILECIGASADTENIEVLQNRLKQELSGKKFLFVFDDDWNKDSEVWGDFIMPFKSGKHGSKIIVTARADDVASVRATVEPYRPQILGENEGWSLFAKFAFADKDPVKNQELEELGKQIVEKCKGLPLAIKTIGALLGSSSNIDYWTKILDNPLWDKTGILPSLRISYKNLSSPLKRCFAYCSLFPKDYVFKKEKLILLWMAEGFLHESNNQALEQIGDEYFSTLVSRSFFEKPIDDKSNDETDDHFTMHDLVNDLAVSMSTQFTLRLESDNSSGNSRHTRNKVHHLSYVIKDFKDPKKFEFPSEVNKLRTFLPLTFDDWGMDFYLTKKVRNHLLPTLKCLRVLSLSGYKHISELPSSIGEFKHLRYLNLSKIKVERLPDSTCLLCNLQTLDISYCYKLVALPREMWKLINLRHLILIRTNIKEMHVQLGRLKSLQTLDKFIVGKHNGSCIGELRALTNLHGSLCISNLQNVESPSDIGLRDRKYLQKLELEWDSSVDISKCQRLVLDALHPHSNLKRLNIRHYHGESFSDWVGNPLFSNLSIVELKDCNNCKTLPPIGQLSSLEKLYIEGFDEVVSVGSEFYGSSPSSPNPFGALKFLEFSRMAKWEKWISYEAKNGSMAFPQLETLMITDCPELRGLPVHAPLAKLDVTSCPKLMAPLPRSIRHLYLSKCNGALSKDLPAGLESVYISELEALESLFESGIPPALKSLGISSCEQFKSLPEGTRDSNIMCLENLWIWECPSFMSLPKGDLLSKLTELWIDTCGKIESFPEEALNSNNCLQTLRIQRCSSLLSLPKGGLPSTLERLCISYCDKLESFPERMVDSNISLRELQISNCSSLVCLPKDGLPSSLRFLFVWHCIKLELPTPPYYSALKRVCLYGCDSLETFPLDFFSELEEIQIGECRNLKSLSLPENDERHLVATDISIDSCPEFVSFPIGGLPAPSLASFCLKNCESMRSLPDNMHELLPSLERLDLENCPKLELFPERGFPRNLKSIAIDYKLATSRMGWGLPNLPFLKYLQIFGKFQDVASFPEKRFLPPTLTSLEISNFPNLKSLDKKGFQHLSVLEILYIEECPKLKHLSKLLLPASLFIIRIRDCPLLKNWCQSKEGKKWLKDTHVEQIWIGNELIG